MVSNQASVSGTIKCTEVQEWSPRNKPDCELVGKGPWCEPVLWQTQVHQLLLSCLCHLFILQFAKGIFSVLPPPYSRHPNPAQISFRKYWHWMQRQRGNFKIEKFTLTGIINTPRPQGKFSRLHSQAGKYTGSNHPSDSTTSQSLRKV